MTIHIEQWDEEKFFSARNQWDDLLNRSSADKLFLSWEWQSTWWKTFANTDNNTAELHLLVATNDDKKLVGIAPLFSNKVKTKKLFNTNRLQFIGNFWRGHSTMPTELLDFIVDAEITSEVTEAFCRYINDLKFWDEFIFPYLNSTSTTYKLLTSNTILTSCYLRHAENYKSYYLITDGDFQSYTKALGKSTRLKLLNRRAMLEKLGEISFEKNQNKTIEENFELLNNLHSQRWGKPIFTNKRLAFNIEVANLLSEKNYVNFSILSLNQEPISIQYNYLINNHNYNIQAGFNENFHKKISLGFLHFGYEIESCFQQPTTCYDFLAGEGKNTQYKERLTQTNYNIVDLQIVRQPLLKLLYKSYDFLNADKNS